MKNLLTIMLALVLLALLPSCAARGGRHRMDLVDSLINDQPDSALKLLLAMPLNQHRRGANEARYNMLLTEAAYKSDGITLPDSINPLLTDSIIGISVSYYELHGEPADKSRARYLAGIVDFSNGDYNEAIIDFLMAEKFSGKSDDSYKKALGYRSIADCFDQLHDISSALRYYRLASKEFEKTPYKIYFDYSLYDEARMQICLKNYNEVVNLLDSCGKSASNRNDSSLLIYVARLRGQCEMQMDQPYKAIKTFNEIMKADISAMTPRDYSFLGECLLAVGDYKGAKQILDSSLSKQADITDFYNGSNSLIEKIMVYDGDYKAAYEKSIEGLNYQGEVISKVWRRDFNSVIDHYYRVEERIASENNKKIKERSIFIIIISTILIIVCILVYQIRINKLRRKMNGDMLVAQNLKSELTQRNNQMSVMESILSHQQNDLSVIKNRMELANGELETAKSKIDNQEKERQTIASNMQSLKSALESSEQIQIHLQDSVRKLLGEKFDILDSLCMAYCANKAKTDEKTRIYRQVMSILSSLKEDVKVISRLETTINIHADNLLKRVREQLPNLTEAEIKLYIFSVLGMSTTSMSVIFDVNYNTICVRKSKLKKKIKSSNAVDAEKFSMYMS